MIEQPIQEPEEYLAVDAATTAYAGCEGYTFNDQPLEPYSGLRRLAGQRLGVSWGFLTEDQSLALANGEAYPGAQLDVTIALYLCLSPASESRFAFRRPNAVIANAIEWADKVDLWRPKNFELAFQLFLAMEADVSRSRDAAMESIEEAGGEPGK